MEKQILVKPASAKQLAYIKRLSREMGKREVEVCEEMSSSDASRIISELIVKARKSGATNSSNTSHAPSRSHKTLVHALSNEDCPLNKDRDGCHAC